MDWLSFKAVNGDEWLINYDCFVCLRKRVENDRVSEVPLCYQVWFSVEDGVKVVDVLKDEYDCLLGILNDTGEI